MRTFTLLLIFLLGFSLKGLYGQTGNCDPDSLQEITVSGIVSIEVTGVHAKYYLVTDSDTYILNFGPWWYQPAVGNAIKPEEGSSVTIFGGLNTTNPGVYPVLVVYEIDGLFWRNPYDPSWNQFNDDFSPDPETFAEGIACGWPDCNVTTETYAGIVMVDTTMVFYHYFLDTDLDGLPDYRLNFGPPWYDPPGEVILPADGDYITVEGAIVHVTVYPIVIVFTLNGELWRDDSGFGPGSLGKWMHGNQNASVTIQNPFDGQSQIRFEDGWHGNGLPASMYCQMLEWHHQNLYQHEAHHAFAGFEVACFNQNRENLMHTQQHQHGMAFGNAVSLQFHYTQAQMDRYRIRNQDRIRLHYWDRQTSTWVEETAIAVDTLQHLITLETESLQAFYLLSAEQTTGIQTPISTGQWFRLRPNPADVGITVDFTRDAGEVTITLTDARGRTVSAQHLTGVSAGYTYDMKTTHMAPGLYYLSLSTGSGTESLPVAVQR